MGGFRVEGLELRVEGVGTAVHFDRAAVDDGLGFRPEDQQLQRESSLLTTYWSGSTDVFGGPASQLHPTRMSGS